MPLKFRDICSKKKVLQFLVAEYKEHTADFYHLFDWIEASLRTYCEDAKDVAIWLHPESEEYRTTIHQKLKRNVHSFSGNAIAGITEMNWYLKPRPETSPFDATEQAAGIYGLISDETQASVAQNSLGLHGFLQESATWGFNEKGIPTQIGAVLECLRMVTFYFRTMASDFSTEEKLEKAMPYNLSVEALDAVQDDNQRAMLLQGRLMKIKEVKKSITAKPVPLGISRIRRR